MVAKLRFFLTASLLVAAAASQAVGLLVVQSRPIATKEPDPSRNFQVMLANKLDIDGRVIPVSWSLSDPVFRSAVNDKKIRNTDIPTKEEILKAATVLHCDMVLLVEIWDVEGRIHSRGILYNKGNEVFRSPKTEKNFEESSELIQVLGTVEDSLRVAADAWAEKLFLGPLSHLKPKVRHDDPDPLPGTNIRISEPTPAPKVDNKQLLEQVMKLLGANQNAQAVAMLRDAVDAEPFDQERREVLCNTLFNMGLLEQAAMQARRSAALVEDKGKFFALAAKAWLTLGKSDEAATDLNEAATRDPENPETRLLLAEIAIIKQQYPAAVSHLEVVFSKMQTPDAYWQRALLKLFTEGPEAAAGDLAESKKGLTPLKETLRYRQVISTTEELLVDAGVEARALFEDARTDHKKAGLANQVAALKQKVNRSITACEWVNTPLKHKTSNGERLLALKLLSQSLSELEGYLASPDNDLLDDATINLGEAIKGWRAAQDLYQLELKEQI